jgi:oxygen-independent coproporphyrinogen-3 oxidase
MAGIYIHIPFCKKACHYCNFHFSTTLRHKLSMCEAISKELILRKQELAGQPIESVYFGGGTPSLLLPEELSIIIDSLQNHFDLSSVKEFTLEANPDDITEDYLLYLKQTPFNRLSLGVQSFLAQDLVWMNRAHTVSQATNALSLVKEYGFKAISLDLMYGLPNLSHEEWIANIEMALNFSPEHISAYCLTVEPKTAMAHSIETGKMPAVDEEIAETQFIILRSLLLKAGYIHYEISNFAKPDKLALHNTNYWKGENYLGVGPAAHSFNGKQRSWNVANNQLYLKAIQNNELPITSENLTESNKFNEYIMTSLRTIWGINLVLLEQNFGSNRKKTLLLEAENMVKDGKLILTENSLCITEKALFYADGIASNLFQLD